MMIGASQDNSVGLNRTKFKETKKMKMTFEEIRNKFMEEQTANDKPLSTITWASDRLWKWVSENFVPVEAIVRQGVPQPVFACGHCIDCEHYEKIDDTEVQHEETFWETCHHPDINEMLVWDCEKIGCTEFKKRASKSA
jgi:hypothetical protein